MGIKKVLLVFTYILVSHSLLLAQTEYTGQTIEEILALPDEEIDLGIACLVLAKDAYPNMKVEVFDNISDRRYITDVEIPEKAVKNGVYLRTLSKKEYIASLLLNNARHFHERESNLQKAIHYLHLAVSIDSTFSSGFWNLGIFYGLFAKELEKQMISEMNGAYMVHKAELTAMQPRRFNESLLKPNDYSVKLPELPRPTLMPQGWKPPFAFPLQAPSQPYHRTPTQQEKQLPAIKQRELQGEINVIRARYIPQIEEALARSDWCKRKAEELGLVHKFPEEFFLRQAKSIEEFKKTGKY